METWNHCGSVGIGRITKGYRLQAVSWDKLDIKWKHLSKLRRIRIGRLVIDY